MFDRTVFFRLVGWVGTLGELRSKSPIVKPIHPLLERDRAKKDYGRLPARAEVRSTSIRGSLHGQNKNHIKIPTGKSGTSPAMLSLPFFISKTKLNRNAISKPIDISFLMFIKILLAFSLNI